MVRRVVVLVVFVGLIAGAVSALSSLFGGDETTSADSTIAPEASAGSVTDSVAETTPTAQSLPVTDQSTTTTTTPTAARIPTTADPARVLLTGDSEAGGLSPFLKPVIEASGLVVMDTDYKSSTGLTRPDYYDWPARLREQIPSRNPDIVIALFGGNDAQPFPGTNDRVDSPEWRAEYAKRVAEVIAIMTEGGRTLIWVGVPNAESEKLTAGLKVQNEVVKAELANHPEVVFVDSWQHFTGIDGGFAPYAFDPRDGETKPVRSETDGFHLNKTGEEILAVYTNSAVTDALKARGAAIG